MEEKKTFFSWKIIILVSDLMWWIQAEHQKEAFARDMCLWDICIKIVLNTLKVYKTTAMYHTCRETKTKENRKNKPFKTTFRAIFNGKVVPYVDINTKRRKYFKNNKIIILSKSCEK